MEGAGEASPIGFLFFSPAVFPDSSFARRVSDLSIVVRYGAKVSGLMSPAHTVKKTAPLVLSKAFFPPFLPFCLLRSSSTSLPQYFL